MLSVNEQKRYLRHILLKEVGGQGQQRLKNARVMVIGAGGLGAPIIQYLAAAGIGEIGVIDDDHVDISNLQRQVIFDTANVGAPKATTAATAAAALNPEITVKPHTMRINDDNAAALLRECDVVVEGVDSFDARYVINRAAMNAATPLVSAAIGRFDGQLSVFAPHAGDFPCYRCFAPEPPPRDAVVNCAEEGVLGPVAGVMGSLAALETLKVLLHIGDPMIGRLLIYDGLSQQMRNIALPRDPKCIDCGTLPRPMS